MTERDNSLYFPVWNLSNTLANSYDSEVLSESPITGAEALSPLSSQEIQQKAYI